MNPLIFALFAGDDGQLARALVLVESIRAFAGEFARAPVEIYLPPGGGSSDRDSLRASLEELGATLVTFDAPPEAGGWPYAAKVFAAAEAERRRIEPPPDTGPNGREETTPGDPRPILVWVDDDTVVLSPPREFLLPTGVALGWRPVMHTNVGLPWGAAPDPYWAAIDRVLAVPADALFPMRTVADGATIRPFFNAGCLAVRPERGILRSWAAAMRRVTADSTLAALCATDARRRTFLHQAALTGAVLTGLPARERIRLPDTVNYPLQFHARYPAGGRFDSIDGRTTIRTEAALEARPEDPMEEVFGPEIQLSWLRRHLRR